MRLVIPEKRYVDRELEDPAGTGRPRRNSFE
jgi:hypothetical protein